MSLIGAQIPELEALKASFLRQSGQVEQLMATLRGDVANTYWQGRAAESFRSAWESDFEPALSRLAAALVDAGDEAGSRAARLVQADS
jgi:WXG100 family type VII secretion target